MKPIEKAWLCPWICDTCRTARLRCPACRMKIRAWLPPASGGSLATEGCVKDYPPSGSGRHLPPRARERIEANWLQGVMNTIEAHHNAGSHAPGTP
eukprot:10893323-Heterocapsa_arctica.AAC.1